MPEPEQTAPELTSQQKATAARQAKAETKRREAAEAAAIEAETAVKVRALIEAAESEGRTITEQEATDLVSNGVTTLDPQPDQEPPEDVASDHGLLGLHDDRDESVGTSGSTIRGPRRLEERVPFSELHTQPTGPNGSVIRPPRYHFTNQLSAEGTPDGGYVEGLGIRIDWQKGPLGTGTARRQPNGAFVEAVIEAAKQRIAFYQEGDYACVENATAIEHLELALDALHSRTANREARGVEGTSEV